MTKEGEKEAWGERGIILKTSALSYIMNYILIFLFAILLSIIFPLLNIQFSLQPKTITEIFGTAVVFGFLILMCYLFEEPFIEKMMRKYVITNEEIIKIEGILRKNRIAIPTRGVSDITVHKGIVGRLLNFGDVIVRGFKNEIRIKGIREPEIMYRIIKNKIAIVGKKGRKKDNLEIESELEKEKRTIKNR